MSLSADDLFYRPTIPASLQKSLLIANTPLRLRVWQVDFLLRELLPDPWSGRMRPDDEKWQIMREIAELAGDNVMDNKQGTLWQNNRRLDQVGYIDLPENWWARPLLLHMIDEFIARRPGTKDQVMELRQAIAGD